MASAVAGCTGREEKRRRRSDGVEDVSASGDMAVQDALVNVSCLERLRGYTVALRFQQGLSVSPGDEAAARLASPPSKHELAVGEVDSSLRVMNVIYVSCASIAWAVHGHHRSMS